MGSVFSISVSCDNMFSRCSDCIARQPTYAFELGENLALLRNDWNELKRRMNDIKGRIEVEERHQQMKRLKVVDGWLLRVEAMEAEVDQLIRDGSQESANKCLGGHCPKHCKTSDKLGREVAKKQREVSSLMNKGTFDVVTDRESLPQIDERPAELMIGMESTFDEVWGYIRDDQVGIMGLYGMGGVGKTTLLTQVNNRLCNLTIQSFDVVIWIVVSKTPNFIQVQDDIGEKIGFFGGEWKYKSQENKAIDILRGLKEKKYLLLLDDIWDRFDLVNLGIPLPNPTNKSKVVFTTRLKGVCSLMKAHKKIEVKCLTDEVAWNLFKKEVGEEALQAHPEIPELAKVVAKECGGLPLALITIGRAMASKMIPQAWHHAIELLKRSTLDFTDMEEKVFFLLKFSYDTLPIGAIRYCFLYCSLYSEDEEISKEKLIDYWICEDFLVKFNDLSKARNEGHDYISTLVHASLLEECSPEKVKMHDVIRDMAIWIACDCGAKNDKFFVQARAGLSEIPNVVEWEGAERVSLMYNRITEFTGAPNCHNLLTLFLNGNCYCGITSGFFQYMPNLRVLNLSGNRGCTNSILKEICALVTLQYLDLSYTGVEELPTEFQNLINLKYLNLSRTRIRIIREGVLSSFKKLQMLKLLGLGLTNPCPWEHLHTEELESLEYLNDLAITVGSDFGLSDFLSSQKLMRITTALTLVHLRGTRYIDMLVLKEMRHLESLRITGWSLEEFRMGKGKADFLNIIDHNYFPQLRTFFIQLCTVLKDITWLAFAPNLETIQIMYCSGMKEVVGGWKWDEEEEEEEEEEEDGDHQQINMEIIPFAKLTTLHLIGLGKLESIYPTNLYFPCLENLRVKGCPKLKKLPLNSSNSNNGKSGGNTNTISIEGEEKWWNGLEWEDEATRLAFLPSFKPLRGS